MAGSVQAMVHEVMDIRQASEYLGVSGDTLSRYALVGCSCFQAGEPMAVQAQLLDGWMVEKIGIWASAKVTEIGMRQKKPSGRAR